VAHLLTGDTASLVHPTTIGIPHAPVITGPVSNIGSGQGGLIAAADTKTHATLLTIVAKQLH
jgi:hypothetical protein